MIIPPFFLYAETHYRFKYFFSFLKKNEPEILVDAPYRIDPGAKLPVMILIKDADKYPVSFLRAAFAVKQQGKILFTASFEPAEPIVLKGKYWWKIIDLEFPDREKNIFGSVTVSAEITIGQNGKTKIIRNNNHRTSSKTPLTIYRSRTTLPAIPGWIFGDAHTHSTYTEDQVEFGSPIPAGPALCKAMGLSFFCVTDHSYDLDDTIGDYLTNDPSLPKWKLFHNDVNDVNREENNFSVIRGEEVSCTNSDGRNVHLLLLGTRKYFHGSGDSAERWLKTKCEHTVDDILRQKDLSVAAYAGHPTEEVPFLQRLLINRGEWTKKDIGHHGLDGIQILNGEVSEHFFNGMDVWKWLLLKGEKKFILAGNDAHGNYNRFIQIGIPFFAIREKETQLFGKMKTAVYASPSEENILSALRRGKTVITNGPLLTIEIETDDHSVGKTGDSVRGKRFLVKVIAVSTPEFGQLKRIRIILGTIGKKEKDFSDVRKFSRPYQAHFITEWESIDNFSYIRAELTTKEAEGIDSEGFCYTNPIWIHPV